MPHIVCYAIPLFIILVVIRKYRESKWQKCKNKVKLTGKVAVITGANSGIGFEIAKELATREADVIFACRNLDSAKVAINKIKQNIGLKSELIPMKLDLSSLKSIKEFSDELTRSYPQIDLLINNAGVSYPRNEYKKTEDGFEAHFGVNHLGHFYLTSLLLDTLKKSAAARLIIVSSLLHEKAKLNLDDLYAEKQETRALNLYASSKLANMYFCRELAPKCAGSSVNVYAICPGWVYTGLFRNHKIRWYHYIAITPVAFLFMRSPKQGAQTAIYCATEPDLVKENGFLYRNCEKYTSKHNFDNELGRKLWDASETMLKEKGFSCGY